LKPVAPRCRCSIPCDREFGVGKGVKVKFQAIPRAQKRLQKRTTLMIRVFGPWLRSPVVGRYVQRLLKCYIYIYIYIYIYLFICLFSLYVIHIYIYIIYIHYDVHVLSGMVGMHSHGQIQGCPGCPVGISNNHSKTTSLCIEVHIGSIKASM
jgi:hypothetical protein